MRYRGVGFVCLCLVGMALLNGVWAGEAVPSEGKSEGQHLLLFLGRLHVVVLHLPIGIVLLAAFFEACHVCRCRLIDSRAQLVMWLLASMSAVITVVSGLLLSQEESVLSSAVWWHMWLGIGGAASTLMVVALCRYAMHKQTFVSMFMYRCAVVVSVGVIALAADKGGAISHGAHFIDKHAPWRSAPRVQVARIVLAASDSTSDSTSTPTAQQEEQQPSVHAENIALYMHSVQPVLENRCYKCHGAKKAKSDLRLDSPASIMAGGKGGAIVHAGQPMLSTLYTLVVLDEDDPDIMPSKGAVLTPQQTESIRAWIAGGAHLPNYTAPVSSPEPIEDTALPQSAIDHASKNIPAPNAADCAQLTASGVSITALSSNGALLDVDMRYAEMPLPAAGQQALQRIATHIRRLDYGRTQIDDRIMTDIGRCVHLQRLMMHETQITDAGLAALSTGNTPELAVLNLYKTAITDAGLQHLRLFKKLKKVYLWNTHVTAAGVRRLQQQLPQLTIIYDQ